MAKHINEDSQSMKRVFIGVPVIISQEFNNDMMRLKSRFHGYRISWVKPQQMHITLRFIGDLSESDLNKLMNVFNEFSFTSAIDLQVCGLGILGSFNNPRVIYAKMKDAEIWYQLYLEVNNMLDNLSLDQPQNPYYPHLTLGRIRKSTDPHCLKRSVSTFRNHFSLYMDELFLCLFESRLKSTGPEYTILSKRQLG